MKKIKELTEKQDKRLSYILGHTKSKRIKKKTIKRLMDGSFGGTFKEIEHLTSEKNMMEKLGFRKGFNPDDRIVKQEKIKYKDNEYLVSTVDLGIDHSFGSGKPLYYETMIFAIDDEGELDFSDLYCNRYTTKDEALKNHEHIIKCFENNEVKISESGYVNIE